jgi:hypothetical protein
MTDTAPKVIPPATIIYKQPTDLYQRFINTQLLKLYVDEHATFMAMRPTARQKWAQGKWLTDKHSKIGVSEKTQQRDHDEALQQFQAFRVPKQSAFAAPSIRKWLSTSTEIDQSQVKPNSDEEQKRKSEEERRRTSEDEQSSSDQCEVVVRWLCGERVAELAPTVCPLLFESSDGKIFGQFILGVWRTMPVRETEKYVQMAKQSYTNTRSLPSRWEDKLDLLNAHKETAWVLLTQAAELAAKMDQAKQQTIDHDIIVTLNELVSKVKEIRISLCKALTVSAVTLTQLKQAALERVRNKKKKERKQAAASTMAEAKVYVGEGSTRSLSSSLEKLEGDSVDAELQPFSADSLVRLIVALIENPVLVIDKTLDQYVDVKDWTKADFSRSHSQLLRYVQCILVETCGQTFLISAADLSSNASGIMDRFFIATLQAENLKLSSDKQPKTTSLIHFHFTTSIASLISAHSHILRLGGMEDQGAPDVSMSFHNWCRYCFNSHTSTSGRQIRDGARPLPGQMDLLCARLYCMLSERFPGCIRLVLAKIR